MSIIKEFWTEYNKLHKFAEFNTQQKLKLNETLCQMTLFFDKRLRTTLRNEESEIVNLIINMESLQDENIKLKNNNKKLEQQILELQTELEDNRRL